MPALPKIVHARKPRLPPKPKSDAIQKFVTENPGIPTGLVVEALAKQGIATTRSMVKHVRRTQNLPSGSKTQTYGRSTKLSSTEAGIRRVIWETSI